MYSNHAFFDAKTTAAVLRGITCNLRSLNWCHHNNICELLHPVKLPAILPYSQPLTASFPGLPQTGAWKVWAVAIGLRNSRLLKSNCPLSHLDPSSPEALVVGQNHKPLPGYITTLHAIPSWITVMVSRKLQHMYM